MKKRDRSRILFFSRFRLTDKGGGGCRREFQIAQALSPLKYKFISYLENRHILKRVRRKIIPKRWNQPFWSEDIQMYVNGLRSFSEKWAQIIDEKINAVILDDPIFFQSLVKKIKQLRIPLIVTCQNIESLSLSQINPKKQNKMFRMELNLLSMADLIITISREETFFLNNMNMNTLYFPYYPSNSIENRLLKIRKIRERTDKSGILMVGTANNRVTMDGFVEVIELWKKRKHSLPDQRLIVGGFGTEKLKEISNSDLIDFRGPIKDSELDEIMGKAKACFCYQKSGAGVLTKIREMQIAGIPIMANFQSARSYYHSDGLIEFNGLSELENILSHIEKWEGNIPIPSKPDPDPLLRAIKNVIH